MQLGFLQPQVHQIAGQLQVVVFVFLNAKRVVCHPYLAPQLAVVAVAQQRAVARCLQGEEPSFLAGLGGGSPGELHLMVGHALQLSLVGNQHLEAVGVLQHVLRKLQRLQRGLSADFHQAGFLPLGQPYAAAQESVIDRVQQALLLGR